ncbi:hypothetical protein GJ744_006916 [Endocarpon pusillum]|uniref:Uncharacterized protein n=1 Tax=Endocarpon pusillum TaxID=364733 RepID=A0A8H7E6H0_9EURO|nr:hypothetical protein GJ744_006916 [Endocarpon pusillum]
MTYRSKQLAMARSDHETWRQSQARSAWICGIKPMEKSTMIASTRRSNSEPPTTLSGSYRGVQRRNERLVDASSPDSSNAQAIPGSRDVLHL